jgi:hypothetical protein
MSILSISCNLSIIRIMSIMRIMRSFGKKWYLIIILTVAGAAGVCHTCRIYPGKALPDAGWGYWHHSV